MELILQLGLSLKTGLGEAGLVQSVHVNKYRIIVELTYVLLRYIITKSVLLTLFTSKVHSNVSQS